MSSAAKEAKSSERSHRKHHSEEFRQEAVQILEKGRTATQLARELGVSTWSLCQWKKRYGVGKAADGSGGRSHARTLRWRRRRRSTRRRSGLPSRGTAARSVSFDYIETFYNPVRRHSSLGFLPPVNFQNQHANN